MGKGFGCGPVKFLINADEILHVDITEPLTVPPNIVQLVNIRGRTLFGLPLINSRFSQCTATVQIYYGRRSSLLRKATSEHRF